MVITRFAPSPTGYMHVGNLRTALYAYLFSRHNDGKFYLRVEDTDKKREIKGSIDFITKTLKTFNLDYDKFDNSDFYLQSEHKNNYLDFAMQLLNDKKAYVCDCDDNPCVCESKNLRYSIGNAIRFSTIHSPFSFTDLVFGEINIDATGTVQNIVLLKKDGYPTYHFAHIVDDHLMNVSHVMRGSEYLSVTSSHVAIHDALKWNAPSYVHLPLIGTSNLHSLSFTKFSKRNRNSSVQFWLDNGYLPEAILNYIVFLGWNPGTIPFSEKMSLSQMANIFDVYKINTSNAIFDEDKLNWFNKIYVKDLEESQYEEYILKNMPKEYHKLSDTSNFFDIMPETKTVILNSLQKKKVPVSNSEISAAIGSIKTFDSYTENQIIIKLKDFPIETVIQTLQTLYKLIHSNDDLLKVFKEVPSSKTTISKISMILLSGTENSLLGGFTVIKEILGNTESKSRLTYLLSKINSI